MAARRSRRDRKCPTQLATDPNFNAQVESEVARRVQSSQTEQQAAALSAAGAEGQRTAALATLGAMIDRKFLATPWTRSSSAPPSAIWFSQIHAGGDKPPAEHVAEAMRLNEARVEQIAATSGETSGDALGEVHADSRGGYQTFAGAYMGALFNESTRLGESTGR